jgi:SAM-dependent methyltransferase
VPVHDVAARGFGDGAESYERARPSYPPDAVAALVTELRIEHGRRVGDLAAGTGKLTRLLVPTGAALVAIEPVSGMRTVLHRELPPVATVAAVAERLPFGAGALDAVVVAQAFHWFDAALALAELHRVIAEGGRLGLVWNAWDGTVPWIHRLHGVVGGASPTVEWTRGHWSRDWVVDAIAAHGGFGPVHRLAFRHVQPMARDEVVARVATTSHIASAPPAARARVLDEVRTVLADDPATRDHRTLDFSYLVDVFWCERP